MEAIRQNFITWGLISFWGNVNKSDNSAEIVRKLVLKCLGIGGPGQVLGLMNIITG